MSWQTPVRRDSRGRVIVAQWTIPGRRSGAPDIAIVGAREDDGSIGASAEPPAASLDAYGEVVALGHGLAHALEALQAARSILRDAVAEREAFGRACRDLQLVMPDTVTDLGHRFADRLRLFEREFGALRSASVDFTRRGVLR